ncbi:MAG: tetratricopeptide repeat protein [Treponema sp.]|uniref:tetratricopeptide repeat protein n=1 Tax=Treponema sp. TaxID=166 RepID=UPI00298DFEB0|nr:tetratricopeptide repeat protein [Treponema sp.]MDD5811729.1 tetratricopeptide repeat protein [Treponema sp.]MDY5885399.1 tetratricopeptide repeat protein [Treponema sp.]
MKRGENNSSNNGSIVKKKGKIIPVLLISIVVVTVVSFLSIFLYRVIKTNIQKKPTVTRLQIEWSEKDYAGVYNTSDKLLEKNPLNNTALTYHGYSAFYIGVSETDPTIAQSYIDESIRSLRLALMSAKEKTAPQIKYMLGKAYFYKNIICCYHYYADLVVKYLEEAIAEGYSSDDIPELLGLSYGQLGMPYDSIKSFSDALLIRESDFLLFNIAKEYYAQGQISAAKQYLYQVTSKACDDALLLKSQNLLAKIYMEEDKIDEARELYEQILDKDQNSAEAHYGLGLVYELSGDAVKARAEYRKCLKIDSTFDEAVKKVYK